MKYVLDTDTLIYFLKGHPVVMDRVAVTPPSELFTTIINKTELLFGAFHSAKIEQNIKKVKTIMQDIQVLDFCHASSFIFAEEKARLKMSGKIIEDMDLMIASIVVANDGVLITNNAKHFERIKKLKLDNWTKA